MSQENLENVRGVRTPISGPSETNRRTLDERIFVMFPALPRLLALGLSRLPPRARLRRAFLSRALRRGSAAGNRRDFAVLVLGLDPEIEFHADIGSVGVDALAPPDMVGVRHGHEAYIQLWDGMFEAAEDFELRFEEMIDFGDRLFAAGRFTGHGTSSGVPFSQPVFQVFTLRRGLVIRQRDFSDRDKALEAAGLTE